MRRRKRKRKIPKTDKIDNIIENQDDNRQKERILNTKTSNSIIQ